MKNWLALATLRSKQNLPKSHCLYEQTTFVQPAYVEKIPYSMPIDSMYWVVKWATLRKRPKLIRIGPQGAPNRARARARMKVKDPSPHELSSKQAQAHARRTSLSWKVNERERLRSISTVRRGRIACAIVCYSCFGRIACATLALARGKSSEFDPFFEFAFEPWFELEFDEGRGYFSIS